MMIADCKALKAMKSGGGTGNPFTDLAALTGEIIPAPGQALQRVTSN
jgi:hypothetical protein